MKLKTIFSTLLIGWGCWACSEDALTPGDPYHSFGPDADATDEESVLRREFFETNGFYIIFNDTIYSEYLGTDAEGEPVYKTETVDPGWSFTGMDEYTDYRFIYFQTIEEKRARAEFVAGLVKIMEEHNLTTPYSVLAVKKISVFTEDYYGYINENNPDFLNTLRCFIVALPEVSATQEEKYLLVANMAGSGLSVKYEKEFQDFYNVMTRSNGSSYYGYSHWGADLEEHLELGFLEVVSEDYYPSKAEDVAAYMYMLLTRSDEEIRAEYPQEYYPKIIQKYELIRAVALKSGIKF